MSSSYRSGIRPRTTTANVRSSRNTGIMGGINSGVTTRMYQSYSSSGNFGAQSGLGGLAQFAGIPIRGGTGGGRGGGELIAINVAREREKRDLVTLNDKFAQYVEKVRFLEAQNRKLQMELDAILKRSGQGSSKIKEMYEMEMTEAKQLIDDTQNDRAAAEAIAKKAMQTTKREKERYDEVSYGLNSDRSAVDQLQLQIAENEAQISLFRRRLSDLEQEAGRYKAEAQRIMSEIGRLQTDIQNEQFLKSTLDTEKMALTDELLMSKQLHETDLADIRSKTVVDVNLDASQFFRNELSQAIQEIRNEYESSVEHQRSDLRSRYMLIYNELVTHQTRPQIQVQSQSQEDSIRASILKMKNESGYWHAKNEDLNNRIKEIQIQLKYQQEYGSKSIAQQTQEIQMMRQKLLRLTQEYDEVTNMKTSLEEEINQYRYLLEGKSGLKPIVDQVVEEANRIIAERATSSSFLNTNQKRSTTIQRTHFSIGGGSGFISGSSGGGGSSVRASASTTVTVDRYHQYLLQIASKYEINRQWEQRLRLLEDFEIILLCDDSGSMKSTLGNSSKTRWDELKQLVQIIVDISVVFDSNGVDVYFLNRKPLLSVTSTEQLNAVFAQAPHGLTPLVPILKQILRTKSPQAGDKKLLIFIATDGAPTDELGNTNVPVLEQLIRQERSSKTTYLTFLACTDDSDAVSYLANWDRTMEHVDVVDDYRSEKAQIQRAQGSNYPFSYGDYIVKALLGSIDPRFDKLNERS